jgi:streptogramin lyase
MIREYGRGPRARHGQAWPVVGKRILSTLLVVASFGVSLSAPAAGQLVEEFRLPSPNSTPNDIIAGPDGNLWFTERSSNMIGRITPDTVTITEFPAAENSQPYEITAGADALWFTERSANQIGRMTPDGVLTEFPLPSANSEPCGITTGADGNVWFSECNASRVGRIASDGTITEFSLATGQRANGIGAGPNAGVWFTSFSIDTIGRVGLASPNAVTGFPVRGGPLQITMGPDGNLWFTEAINSRIGRLTPAGVLVDFSLPAPDTLPSGITAGPDGNVWFTERSNGLIGRITPSGAITEFVGHDFPTGITAGPDGKVWFTESVGNRIGRVTPPALAECGASPQPDCRKPTVSRKAQVLLKNKTGKAKDTLSWQWTNGAATTFAEFGDPIYVTNYAVCIYDHIGGVPTVVASVAAPGAGVCTGKPCWKALGGKVKTGYQYKAPSGLLKIVLHAGDAGKASITVTNAAANLPLPAFPLHQDPKVTVQVINSNGMCWDANYSFPPIKSDPVQFKAKND